MKKINIKKIDENFFYEKLDNGLDVYMYVNNNIHNNYVTFSTKYGSIYNSFYYDDEKIDVPNGIAHFLEHKVFVQENDPQPEDFFARSGGICNAYTTFKNTTYMFSSPDNVIENTIYLLDFVQSLYLTKENVESEKGIICQEIKMCDDDPNDVLYDKIRENTIKVSPFRNSIIGTKEEVNSISQELLMKCYKTFYNPSNMFLVITGNYDMDEMLSAIKNNQASKKYDTSKKTKLGKYNEPNSVLKDYEEIKGNVSINKVSYNIKLQISKFNMDVRRLSIYMYLIFNLILGDTSEFDSYLKKKGIITNSIYYNLLNIDTHFIISLINGTNKDKELIKELDNCFKNVNIKEEDFIRKKKVLISNEIFSYESMEMINDMVVDNIIFDNKICNNMIDIIENLTYDEMMAVLKKIDFNNKSIVILKK